MDTWTKANPAPRATVPDAADHIDHIRKVAGIDHIGLGGDFDGITSVPEGLEDVSKYPTLTAELLRRGYKDDDIKQDPGFEHPAGDAGGRKGGARSSSRRRPPSSTRFGIQPFQSCHATTTHHRRYGRLDDRRYPGLEIACRGAAFRCRGRERASTPIG